MPYVCGAVVFFTMLLFESYWLSALGVAAFAYFLVRLVQEAGRDLPIESFILVTASVQWVVGPVLVYAGYSSHYKYYMYVPVEQYMMLAVPGVILLAVGLYSLRHRKRVALVQACAQLTAQIVDRSRYLPLYLIATGFVFSMLLDRLPASLAFPGYILSNVKYIGLIYLIFSTRLQHKAMLLAAAFLLTFFSSLKGGMFHDLILWSAFIAMYAAYVFKPTMPRKIVFVLLGLAFIFVLQAVKDEYRNLLKEQGSGEYVEKFLDSVESRFEDSEALQANNVERLINRINQGWIISRIMQIVPSRLPHAEGETVVTAVKASLLPRALFPDKPMAGGKANYEKYTGYQLQTSTSMGISLLGEAYINFGLKGAWVFMLVFGLTSSFIIRQFFRLAGDYPTIWLWFPLILLHFVKAETELLVQLNFLVKSIVLVYLFVWANKRFLRLKL